MGKFRSPQRRSTRQRSGFNVSGDKAGSTCKIELSRLFAPIANRVEIVCRAERVTAQALFTKTYSVIGAGLYLRPTAECTVAVELAWKQNDKRQGKVTKRITLEPGTWGRVGVIEKVELGEPTGTLVDLKCVVTIETVEPVSAFGLMMGPVRQEHLIEHDVEKAFWTKTGIYLPEILYRDPTMDATAMQLVVGEDRGQGQAIVCKSCNRCARFLPVNIEHERKTLSYSNHCVSRAPCTHAAFSTYRVTKGGPLIVGGKTFLQTVTTHHGHQLECITCKKFFVNLPLNPMRDSTQHREDALRRRAFEVLVRELLGKNWVYHEHRIATGKEFDVAIWDKFEKMCFKCEKELPSPNVMDLDHTLPLAYLWPLDSTATCLCSTCNSSKSDKFPVDVYTPNELEKLAGITGLSLDTLNTRPINVDAVQKLFERIEWFFDEFLLDADYQKVREGKKTADLIVHAIHNVLRASGYMEDLVDLYRKKTGCEPTTVSLVKPSNTDFR